MLELPLLLDSTLNPPLEIGSTLILGQGVAGLSAYQLWLKLGNVGTEQDYQAFLKGDKGDSTDFVEGSGIIIDDSIQSIAVDFEVVASQDDLSQSLSDAKQYTDDTASDLATAAQGAKADAAIQSSDLAPVGLSGSFSDLINKSSLFNLVYSAYIIGSNVAIAATDTLGEMLGKLQAQVDSKEPSIGSGTIAQYWRGDKSWRSFATDVLDTALTGLSTATATAVTAADTTLIAIGKLQAQINALSGGASLSFDDSRWMFNDLISTGLVGGFVPAAINSGSVGLPYITNNDGAYGYSAIRSSTSANSGGSILSSTVISGGGPYGMMRSIFKMPSALSARLVRSGFLSNGTAAVELDGTWLEISGNTAVAKSTSGNIIGIQQKGSAVLPLNTWLVCDVEYTTASSARVVIFNRLDNTKYLDEVFTDINYMPNGDVFCGIKAVHSGASTANDLLVVDLVGTGIKRPSFAPAPA